MLTFSIKEKPSELTLQGSQHVYRCSRDAFNIETCLQKIWHFSNSLPRWRSDLHPPSRAHLGIFSARQGHKSCRFQRSSPGRSWKISFESPWVFQQKPLWHWPFRMGTNLSWQMWQNMGRCFSRKIWQSSKNQTMFVVVGFVLLPCLHLERQDGETVGWKLKPWNLETPLQDTEISKLRQEGLGGETEPDWAGSWGPGHRGLCLFWEGEWVDDSPGWRWWLTRWFGFGIQDP